MQVGREQPPTQTPSRPLPPNPTRITFINSLHFKHGGDSRKASIMSMANSLAAFIK